MRNVHVYRGNRFLLKEKSNHHYTDVVEISGPDGPEVWFRSLRREGEQRNGHRTVWKEAPYSYAECVARVREFQDQVGCLVREVTLAPAICSGPTPENTI